ncbi:MAG: hypothetical protein WDO24_03570 [Pseudomonadota bacterium]
MLLGFVRLQILDCGARAKQVGLGLRDPGLVIAVLDLDQECAGP